MYGVEILAISRSERNEWEKKIAKARPDLVSENEHGIDEYYELKDGSILEVMLAFSPRDRSLKVYHSDEDVLRLKAEIIKNTEKNKKYSFKTDYEIIAIKYDELAYLGENNARILADSLNIPINSLDSTKASLNLLNKAFIKVTGSEEKDNNSLFKALIYYLARIIKNEVNGKINIQREGNLVTNMIITDAEGRTFKAHIGLPEIWTDGSKITVELDGGKRKRVTVTMESLFDLEVGKYKYSFPSKPSDIFKKPE